MSDDYDYDGQGWLDGAQGSAYGYRLLPGATRMQEVVYRAGRERGLEAGALMQAAADRELAASVPAPRNVIWINTTDGSWGEVEHDNGSLVLVDLDKFEHEPLAGYSPEVVRELLGTQTDGDIAEFGLRYGVTAVPHPTDEQVRSATEVIYEALCIGAAGTDGSHTDAGLMLKIMARLGFGPAHLA